MRRGYAWILMVSVIGLWTPSAFGQYSYPYAPPSPYGPMPAQYGPPSPYGPMPAQAMPPSPYGPMPAQAMPPSPYGPMPGPGYYPQPMPMPTPMPMPNQQQPPRVFVYGPLTATPPDPTAPLPGQMMAQPGMPKGSPTKGVNPNDKKGNIAQAQLTLPPAGARDGMAVTRVQPAPDSCGASCFDDICAPTPIYNFIPQDPIMPGHGHFFAEVGAIAVVPYMNPHSMYTTANASGGASADFPRQTDFGPSVNFGYIAHNGWGIRADYWYLNGNINETLGNTTAGVAITTPTIGGLQISGPSLALANGIGVDQYHFAQRLDVQVADVEAIKECTFLDTTFLFGGGLRYAHFEQGYAATRSNPGGVDGMGNAVMFDRTDFSSISRYEGWGPTLSFEFVHPICGSNFAVYANLRASFLWGVESFQQDGRVQERSTIGGVTSFIDNQTAAAQLINRQIEVGEAEVGVQYGTRLGRRLYLYGRAGVSVQRWFNVGSPTSNNGNVEFFGGTAKIGLTF